jgi:hypothetical protein
LCTPTLNVDFEAAGKAWRFDTVTMDPNVALHHQVFVGCKSILGFVKHNLRYSVGEISELDQGTY